MSVTKIRAWRLPTGLKAFKGKSYALYVYYIRKFNTAISLYRYLADTKQETTEQWQLTKDEQRIKTKYYAKAIIYISKEML